MSRKAGREAMQRELREILKRNRETFKGQYAEEVKALLGLSREDIDAITPDLMDLQAYDQLIEVVKDASRRNLAQAQLKSRIVALGNVAVKIARKVTGLAKVLG